MRVNGVRAAQAEATRSKLQRTARGLFATKGFAATSTEEIVRAAGVTKGALYHHFDDKQGLFSAVVEELEEELAARVQAAADAHHEPWARLQAACHAYLDACTQPDVERVLVLDAPSVLGWDTWCDIDKAYGVAMFEGCLIDAIQAGLLQPQPPEPVAHVLLGALNVAARVVARATDRRPMEQQVAGTIDRLLAGLRTSP